MFQGKTGATVKEFQDDCCANSILILYSGYVPNQRYVKESNGDIFPWASLLVKIKGRLEYDYSAISDFKFFNNLYILICTILCSLILKII